MKTIRNFPERRGQLAGRKETFGERSRYAVAPVHTRFDAVEWFVFDAERPDADGAPSVIRQEPTRDAAISGLTES